MKRPLCAVPKKDCDKSGGLAVSQGSSPGLEKKLTVERNNLGLCIRTLLLMQASETSVPQDSMSSSYFHGHLALLWYTDIDAAKMVIHIN